MELPSIKTSIRDEAVDFTFEAVAYRKLTEQEMHQAFAIWRGQSRKNVPRPGQVVTVTTGIGLNGE